jgi:hypothetical protein
MSLPVDIYATPFEGWKLAYLVRSPSECDPVRFLPLYAPDTMSYGVDAVAKCGRGEAHDPPDPDCTCGFWAVAHPFDLDRLGGWESVAVMVRVAMSGRLVEHEHGWRTRRQQVLEVVCADTCWWCGRRAVGVAEQQGNALVGSSISVLCPSCGHCGAHRHTITELSAELGVTISMSPQPGDVPLTPRQRRAVNRLVIWPALVIATAELAGSAVWAIIAPRIINHTVTRLGVTGSVRRRLWPLWSLRSLRWVAASAISATLLCAAAMSAGWI